MDEKEIRARRIKWKCRRGMTELDILLERFYDAGFNQLSEAQRTQFENLLDLPDPTLFAWLMGHEAPEEEYKEIVRKIKISS